MKIRKSLVIRLGFLIFLPFLIYSCKKSNSSVVNPPEPIPIPVAPTIKPTLLEIKTWLVDKNVNDETAILFYNLKTIAKTNTLFGHQDDTFSGYSWSREAGRSDVKEVTGSYPALYGWDFLNIASFQQNSYFVNYTNDARVKVIEAYKRGGVNTFSWHYWNPVTSVASTNGNNGVNKSFNYADEPVIAVSAILPGGSKHSVFKASLVQVADFLKSLQADGKSIPVIFRPFHEFDGTWFWWGSSYCTPSEYKELYKFTVTYLRDVLQVHNVLFAWSPDRGFNSEMQYLERYPGDDYVDIVGTDNYYDLRPGTSLSVASQKFQIVSAYAMKKNKVAALTETGLNKITQSDWFTQVLLKSLQLQKVEFAYVMIWSNRSDEYFTPYKGHPAESDFIKFKNDPYLIFEDKLTDIYKLK